MDLDVIMNFWKVVQLACLTLHRFGTACFDLIAITAKQQKVLAA